MCHLGNKSDLWIFFSCYGWRELQIETSCLLLKRPLTAVFMQNYCPLPLTPHKAMKSYMSQSIQLCRLFASRKSSTANGEQACTPPNDRNAQNALTCTIMYPYTHPGHATYLTISQNWNELTTYLPSHFSLNAEFHHHGELQLCTCM